MPIFQYHFLPGDTAPDAATQAANDLAADLNEPGPTNKYRVHAPTQETKSGKSYTQYIIGRGGVNGNKTVGVIKVFEESDPPYMQLDTRDALFEKTLQQKAAKYATLHNGQMKNVLFLA